MWWQYDAAAGDVSSCMWWYTRIFLFFSFSVKKMKEKRIGLEQELISERLMFGLYNTRHGK